MRSIWNAARAMTRAILNVQPAAIGLFILVACGTFLSTVGTAQAVGTTKSTTTLTSSPNFTQIQVNVPVTFTATVTGSGGTPTGTVTFVLNQGNTVQTEPLINGMATFKMTFTSAGTGDTIQAGYNGDNTFATSNSTQVTFNVNAATTLTTTMTNLTQSPASIVVNTPVKFTATVTGSGGTPTGTVTFTVDQGNTIQTEPLINGVATFTTSFATAGTGHTIQAGYNGDNTFNTSTSNQVTFTVGSKPSTTTLTATPNPSTPGQPVTFTATVTGTGGTPTGTVTFEDGSTTIGGPVTLNNSGVASFTTSTLSSGSHSITAVFSSNSSIFAGGTSNVLTQTVSAGSSDSTKLREMQVSTTPVIAQIWGQTTAGAMDDAVTAGFGGNPASLSPNGTGFTYYFNDDAPAQPSADADADSLRRYLASPNGSLTSPNGSANSAANDSVKRVDDDFGALGYAGGMPTKAPPPSASATPHDWLAWVTVRGTDYWRNTFGDDLKGDQVDAIAGLTRRISPNFVIGAFGGYEHFNYTSQAFNSVLNGDGWTVGTYLGWKLAPNLRLDAGAAWSDIMANDTAGTASGNFTGTRWLINGGLTGTYPWQQLVFEPSARVFALWEHENAFTDSLGTLQAARNFETGRASVGVKAIYPFAWTSSTVAISPYAGLYADYYFSQDDAQTVGLTTVPLLQGFSARATGGIAASFPGGATLGAGGEFGGIGSDTHIWTWTARGRIPF